MSEGARIHGVEVGRYCGPARAGERAGGNRRIVQLSAGDCASEGVIPHRPVKLTPDAARDVAVAILAAADGLRIEAPAPAGELVQLALSVEREAHKLAEKVRRGEIELIELVRCAQSGDGEPVFALRLLKAAIK